MAWTATQLTMLDGGGLTRNINCFTDGAGNYAFGHSLIDNTGAIVPLVHGHGVAASALLVELPTDGTGIVGLATGTNSIGNIATVSTVSAVTSLTNALPAGTNIIGKVTTDQTTHGTSDLVAADITKVGGSALAFGQATASSSVPTASASGRVVAGSTLTRPATTPTYALGQQIGSAAGTVAAATSNDLPVMITRCRLQKSNLTITSASFRVHVFRANPTLANGDTGTFTATLANRVGWFDIGSMLAGSDFGEGEGAPNSGNFIITPPGTGVTTLWWVIEARAAYVGGTSETFQPFFEFLQ